MLRQKFSLLVRVIRILIIVSLPLFASGQKLTHSLFLIGDAGEPYADGDPIADVFRKQISEAGANATVLYLGDNVYPKGLTYEGERLRKQGEDILEDEYSWVKGLAARAYFIPGNHDWHHWGRKGFDYIINQQRWIDSLKNPNVTVMPRDGCPGPVEIKIDDFNQLVIIDTQWLLHQWDKPGEDSPCEAKTTQDVIDQLNDIFLRNRNKRVIIAAHHPLITYGEHGGIFTLKTHIFPLEALSEHLYIPMPIIGSLYPLYRKFFGHIQDTQHPVYKEFDLAIQEIMKQYPGSVYVAGHEHALEYLTKDSSHFIVSGSGSKVQYVKKKEYAEFAKPLRGFVRMDTYDNGIVKLHYFQVDNQFPRGNEVFEKNLKSEVRFQKPNLTANHDNFTNKFITVKATTQYNATPARKFFLGDNYRKEWATEIQVPVFDIGSEKGGLKILQRGGGQQTLSLRFEDSTGHEYVVRSVEKYPEHAVPEMLRKTFAQDLVQDQISASHPYAALVVPRLAEAAGIYHTNPKLVFIPDDPRLGEYEKLFSNSLAIFEERPAGDWSEIESFGNSKKVVNTGKVLEKIIADNDNQVDQEFVLKSRLFDLITGDWDRHDDQWRWATIKSKKGDLFRPIPRDRDQAFFVNEGKLSKVWSRKWALPKFEGFDDHIDWAPGLSFNARYFDRTFLTELSREHWKAVAQELQQSLTDEAIEQAITPWPEQISKLHGQKIIRALKSRRDHLQGSALELYDFLSREVDVTGSDKDELFEVERLATGGVDVKVFKITKEKEKGRKLYERAFNPSETNEVRLYGLGGEDKFRFLGSHRSKILVRAIGGAGNDTISSPNASSKRPIFYDQLTTGFIKNSSGIKDRREANAEVNDYNRKSFQYNRLAPLVYLNYNPDDGVFVGGGFIAVTHGFRKEPFKQRHLFLASFAPATLSYNFRYQGRFTETIFKWDLDFDVNLKSPNYVNNFFGLGNETVFNKSIDNDPDVSVDDAIDFYRYRFEELKIDIAVVRKFSNWGLFQIGPALQRIEMEEPRSGQDRFISEYAATKDNDLFNEYEMFGGVAWQIGVDKRDNQKFTTRGATFNVSGRNMSGISKETRSFSSYQSSLALYHRFRVPQRVMLAFRIGGGLNTGNYKFYQAQLLDGKSELRGFRKTRFYGDRKFFSNSEVRLKLINFRSYLFPASLGIVGFYDFGRVWYKDENGIDPTSNNGHSTVWHSGIGGGLWFTPFNAATVSAELAHSREGNMAYIRLGFLF